MIQSENRHVCKVLTERSILSGEVTEAYKTGAAFEGEIAISPTGVDFVGVVVNCPMVLVAKMKTKLRQNSLQAVTAVQGIKLPDGN